MKTFISALMLLLVSFQVQAVTENFVEIKEGHRVFYRYAKPQEGKKTVVLLNGLIYAVSNTNAYAKELSDQGYGVLQLAYSTQPESLVTLEDASPFYNDIVLTAFGPLQAGVETQDLVDETMAVVDQLNIDRFTLASLSYGSIVASSLAVQQQHRIDEVIFMAPAVVTSGRYNPYGASRHSYYELLRSFGNLWADPAYDLELYNTLALIISPATYKFESISFRDFFDGVYQMVRSSKWFDLKDFADTELPPTYMFIASREDGPLLEDQKRFWFLMNENPAKKGLVVFEGSFHAIPGVAPKQAAGATAEILEGLNEGGQKTIVIEKDDGLTSDVKNSLINSSMWSSSSK